MKLRLFTALVVAVFALSGSGGALAAALCAGRAAGRMDSCCREKTETHGEGHAPDKHSAQTQDESEGGHCESSAPDEDDAVSHARDRIASVATHEGFCVHCLGRSENQPASRLVRVKVEGRRDHERPAIAGDRLAVSEARPFAPNITPKQGSPPGGHSRRRLLLSVLLI